MSYMPFEMLASLMVGAWWAQKWTNPAHANRDKARRTDLDAKGLGRAAAKCDDAAPSRRLATTRLSLSNVIYGRN
jgi:hypothetical protein